MKDEGKDLRDRFDKQDAAENRCKDGYKTFKDYEWIPPLRTVSGVRFGYWRRKGGAW